MFDDNDLSPFSPGLAPQRQVQRVKDFFELRKEYRLAALVALRKREGLPSPVDEHGSPLETRFDDLGGAYYVSPDGTRVERVLFAGTGRDGKPGSFATGTRKGPSRQEADADWDSPYSGFKILEVAEDGRKLEAELDDLIRDAEGLKRAERVSHGVEGEQAPGLELNGVSDEDVDNGIQGYLKRGPR